MENKSENMVCIVCPVGCEMTIAYAKDGEISKITGNGCKRGSAYAKSEVTNPVRMVTSTVALKGGIDRRLPVITSAPIPKGRIMDVMEEVRGACASVPVRIGDIIIGNVCNLGVDIVASRSVRQL